LGSVLDEYIATSFTSEGVKCSRQSDASISRKGLSASTIGLPGDIEKIVLFGGTDSTGSGNADILVFREQKGEDGSHFQIAAADGAAPPPRMYHSASVTGSKKDLLVIHGGRACGSHDLLNDIWVLDAAAILAPVETAPPPEAAAAKGKGKGVPAKGVSSVPMPVWCAVSVNSPPVLRCLHASIARTSDRGICLLTFGGVGESGELDMDTYEMTIVKDGKSFSEESSLVVGRGPEGERCTASRFGFTATPIYDGAEPALVFVFGGVQSKVNGEPEAQSDVLVLDPNSELAREMLMSLPSCQNSFVEPPCSILTIEYRNGDVYVGEVRTNEEGCAVGGEGEDAIREGEGKMVYADGSTYEVRVDRKIWRCGSGIVNITMCCVLCAGDVEQW
jgi:hypothetical protein